MELSRRNLLTAGAAVGASTGVLGVTDSMSLFFKPTGTNTPERAPLTDQRVWDKSLNNPVISPTSGWRSQWTAWPSLFYEDETYYTFFSGSDGSTVQIGLETSTDLSSWTAESSNPVLTTGSSGAWDDTQVRNPAVWNESGTYHMVYEGFDGTDRGFGIATSSDLVSWTKDTSNPVFTPGSSFESGNILDPFIVLESGTYHLYYTGNDGSGNLKIGHATSSDLYSWTRDSNNPVFTPGSGWDGGQVRCSSVILYESTFYLFYGGTDGGSSDRKMGLATSSDGSAFSRDSDNPLLARGSNWEWQDTFRHGVAEDGTDWHLVYSGQEQQDPDIYSIGISTLPDVPAGRVESWDDGVISPDYSGDTGSFSTTGSQVYSGGQSLTGNPTSRQEIFAGSGTLNYHPTRGDIVNSRIYLNAAPANTRIFLLGSDINNGYDFEYNTGADILRIGTWESGSFTELASESVTQVVGEWVRLEIDLDTAGDGTLSVEAFDSADNSLGTPVSAVDSTHTADGVGVRLNGSSDGNRGHIDHIKKIN